MRNTLFLVSLLFTLISCEKNITNECFGKINFRYEVFLNNPEFYPLFTGPGFVTILKQGRHILLIKKGAENTTYQAFDLECPNHDCLSPMTYDGSSKMTCSCDKSEYGIIYGSPQNNSALCNAYEYNVRQTSNTSLIIYR